MTEADFLALLRPLATHPAARCLMDDAAVLGDLVLTHDVLVEGVHFLPDDPPEDVAWKLVAVNLSDLAAKGAQPVGVLLGYMLDRYDGSWDERFAAGLASALVTYRCALLGGDTVRSLDEGSKSLSLTAVGCSACAPPRAGARKGDALWVTGTIGLAGLGLEALLDEDSPSHFPWQLADMIDAYRRPSPRLAEGQALAPLVHAMMDVSDGLLIDALRMADASGLALAIDLDAIPHAGPILQAVTAGDDYELLFAAPSDFALPVAATRIGTFSSGSGLTLHDANGPVVLPTKLGWEHGI